MTIKPDFVDSDRVKVIKQKNILSKRIQELVDRKKEPDSDLKIVIPEIKTVTIPFKKSQKQIAHPKSLFFTTHTKKEGILFYNYYEHLKKFGFELENTAIDFKFWLNLSKNEKNW